VLAAARHEPQKGLDLLMDAVPQLRSSVPQARVVVAGHEGSASSDLRLRAQDVGAELLGDRNDVPELLCAADVFVLPSRWEGAGSVLIEALALGCPIVATDIPAVRSVVGVAGVLVPPENSAALALGIVDVLTDRVASAQRAELGRSRARKHFSVDPVVTALGRMYERAISDEAR
jgi:glycosyltransferase involved in cell wall biosynthesis